MSIKKCPLDLALRRSLVTLVEASLNEPLMWGDSGIYILTHFTVDMRATGLAFPHDSSFGVCPAP